jgi:hypothetical protein
MNRRVCENGHEILRPDQFYCTDCKSVTIRTLDAEGQEVLPEYEPVRAAAPARRPPWAATSSPRT